MTPRTGDGKAPVWEKMVVRFEVLSPVHIGTQQGELSTLEFLGFKGSVFIVDEQKLAALLVAKGAVDTFVAEVRDKRFVNLYQFISNNRLGDPAAVGKRICSCQVPCANAEKLRRFRPMIRDGLGRVFLPGTAVKGVLRTAVLFSLLSLGEQERMRYARFFHQKVASLNRQPPSRRQREKTFFSSKMQEKLLSSFSLPRARQPQNRDLLRCLKVSDAYPVDGKAATRVINIKFLSKDNRHFYWSKQKRHGENTKWDLELWLEAVVSGTFEAELAWNRQLFEQFVKGNASLARPGFPVKSLKDVLQAAVKFSSIIVQHEKGFFADGDGHETAGSLGSWYTDAGKIAMLRIGFGSGMLSTTVNLAWPEDLRKEIRNVCGHPRGEDPAPKSRRVWRQPNSGWRPMGWTRLMLVEGGKSEVLRKESMVRVVDGRDPGSAGKSLPMQDSKPRKPKLPSTTEKVPPVVEKWQDVHLRWNPGKQEITASASGQKAFCRGKGLVPQALAKKLLTKKKKAKASTIKVEKLGNAWKIIEITP